jgi:hypothetical protein
LIGIESEMDKLLKKKSDNNDLKSPLVEAIASINKNKTMILNEFDHKLRRVDREKNGEIDVGFLENIKQLKKVKLFDIENEDELYNNENIINLYKLITIKFIIGKLIWYILAGTLVASISYNYIININCEQHISVLDGLTKNFHTQDSNSQKMGGYKWKLYRSVDPDDVNIEEFADEGILLNEFKEYLESKLTSSNDLDVDISQIQLDQLGLTSITLLRKHYIKINDNAFFKPIA